MLVRAISIILTASFCFRIATSQVDNSVVEIPFTLEKGFVIVKAKVQGKIPAEMILATGAEYSTLDGASLEKYKLSFGYTYDDPKRCNLADCTYTFADVPKIILGDLSPVSIKMRLNGAPNVEKRLGRSVFGVLGTDFFKDRIVQFDFERKIVRFLSKPITEGDAGKSSQTRIVTKMGFYDDYTTLPIIEDFSYNGKKVRTVLDTGLPNVVILSPGATKQLGEDLPAAKSGPRAGKISKLVVVGYEVGEVPVLFYGKGMGFDRDTKEFGAIAGVGLLQNFRTTFDFRSKTIVLEPL